MKSLASKVALILLATFVLAWITSNAIQRFIVLPGFIELEYKEARRDTKRCVKALNREIRFLDNLCADWASWNDTYEFVKNPYKEYAESNLVLDTFAANLLNLIYIINPDGKVVWGKIYDLGTEETIRLESLPGDAFPKLHPLISYNTSNNALSEVKICGVYMTDKDPMLISSRPILTSNDEGPIRGYFIMGRFLDENVVKTLADETQVSLEILPIQGKSFSDETRRIQSQLATESPYFIEEESEDALLVYATYPDIQANQALLIKARIPRNIFAKGQATIRYAEIPILISALLIPLVMLVLLHWTIVRPVTNLTGHMLSVRNTGDLSARIHPMGRDEIGTLGREFNAMLENLEERTHNLRSVNEQLVCKIEDHKKAREALQKSEERYRLLFENCRDAILLVTKDGRHLDVNQATLDLFGYSKEEILALNARDTYVNLEDRERSQNLTENQGYSKDIEVAYRKKDGGKIDCLVTSTMRVDKDGNFLEYQTMLRDITEKKHLEAQLQQAQKMEAIGTLAGGIAHDFNNLLAVVQGNSSFMEMDMGEGNPYEHNMADIQEAVRRGASLTKQLLGFAEKGKYEVKPIDLNDVMLKTSQMFGRTRKELQILCQYEKDIWAVEADESQIEQVLLNLYVNAAQAMPRGGKLRLQTENATLNESYVSPYKVKLGRYVKIMVTDTGEGMDEATQKRIFDPFFTTKEMGRGTGLGLASVYGIVKSHEGIIEVKSTEEKGTTFTVHLPASEKKVTKKQEKKSETAATGEGTILLVDDEELVIRTARANLVSLGYEVLTAESGEEALRIYEEKEDRIDLVILDMIMPGMGGGETYDRLKDIDPEVIVLLASGYSIDGQAKEILDRGCNDFIQKPFETGELAEKIAEILGKK